MAVPKKKHSSARRDRRRAHDALKQASVARCPNCGAAHRPHRVCPSCGNYKGRHVVTVEPT